MIFVVRSTLKTFRDRSIHRPRPFPRIFHIFIRTRRLSFSFRSYPSYFFLFFEIIFHHLSFFLSFSLQNNTNLYYYLTTITFIVYLSTYPFYPLEIIHRYNSIEIMNIYLFVITNKYVKLYHSFFLRDHKYIYIRTNERTNKRANEWICTYVYHVRWYLM